LPYREDTTAVMIQKGDSMSWAHPHTDEESVPHSRRTNDKSHQRRYRSKPSLIGRFAIDKDTYTSGQAARLLRIPSRTLRRYLSIGRIEGNQNPITQTWHISARALIEFIESQGGEAVVKMPQIKILVIDQRDDIGEMIARVTRYDRPEVSVSRFEQVGDALIQCGAEQPDLIIIDTTSSLFDGAALLRLLRNNARLKKSKLMAIVDAANGRDRGAPRDVNTSDQIIRGITYEGLLATLDRLFPEP
jgi:CheY-like chemotaxis protein